MKKFLRQLGQVALALTKRFLTDSPNNTYERVVFSAIRDIAYNFGKAAMA